jgi:acryloyl-coenzyme A reductase
MRTGVCYRDILTVEGFFPRVTLPIVLGHEIAGIVVDKGCKVDEVDINDKVVALPYISCGECEYCSSGRENLCKNRRWYGEVLNGSYSDHVLVHKNSIVKMDPEVDWNYAAISSCVIGMVIHALDELGDIDEGMKVLVTGAGGGVGIHAIQVAKAYGTEVVAVTSSEDKVDFIRQLNPDHIIVSRGDFSKEVKKTVGPVDIVVEAVGEPTFHSSLRSLKWGGRMAVIGNVNVKPASLPLGLIILRENLIHGVISSTKKSLRKALEMGNKGLVKAIGMEMSLWDVEKAHEILRQKRARGRVFLRP